MSDDDVQCPTCDAIFMVVWSNSIDTYGGPIYCPFCGSEDIDYMRRAAKGARDA